MIYPDPIIIPAIPEQNQMILFLNSKSFDIDIIIIPYIYDKKRVVKSLNRITDSMNLGKLVVTSRMPFNLDLEDYCVLGNIGKGLLWTKENQIK